MSNYVFMIYFVLFICLKVYAGTAPFNKCVNELCKCSDDSKIVNCSCNEEQSHFHLQAFHLSQNLDYLSVQNCENATFYSLAFYQFKIKDLEITNVANIDLQSIIFHDIVNAGTIKKITIKNSNIKKLVQNTFNNVSGIDSIEFVNVTIDTIQSYAFNNISNFSLLIIDSHIGNIENGSFFNVNQVVNIEISNTIIKQVESGAISVNNGQHFTIDNVEFDEWKKNWVTLDRFKKVNVSQSIIQKMEENALHMTNVNHFVFENNVIENATTNAFSAIALPSTKLQFNNNTINTAELKFISDLMVRAVKDDNLDCEILFNTFPCDDLCDVLLAQDKSQALFNNICTNESVTIEQMANNRSAFCKEPELDRGRSIDGETQDNKKNNQVETHSIHDAGTGTNANSTNANMTNHNAGTTKLSSPKPIDTGRSASENGKKKTNSSNNIHFSYGCLLLTLLLIIVL